MGTIKFVTVHHDATLIDTTDERSTASRIEGHRRFHVQERGWADIGYHFIVDRQGRVWEGRSLRLQGAHVENRNPGNVGVVLMGDFDRQQPTSAQYDAMRRHVQALMARYKVSARNVLTHREWSGSSTACPGRNLQSRIADARRRRAFV